MGLIYALTLRTVIFHCPNSINCIISEKGSNIFTCALDKGREYCKVWRLRKNAEIDAPIFWNFLQEIFANITEGDLVYPDRMQLTIEQRNFSGFGIFGNWQILCYQ